MRPPGRLLHVAIVISVSSFCAAACTEETPTTKATSSSSSSSSGGVAKPASAKFNADVIPILATNCALAACHSSKEADGGIYMTYDKEQLYSVFQKTSAAWKIKYVVPGKPEESLLMAKMDGTQAKLCKTGGCGNQMPQEELLPEEEREIVRVWIQNGAKND